MSERSAPAAKVPASATLSRRCASAEEAEALLQALGPDNGTFVRARAEGRMLILEAHAANLAELQRTLDDTLACLSAAERTRSAAQSAPPSSPLEGEEEGDDDDEAEGREP